MENGNWYSVSSSSDDKMSAKREIWCAQLFGVFVFIIGLVGGLLIGIYVYHGGPESEVNCKNLPESLNSQVSSDASTEGSAQTTRTQTSTTQMTTSRESVTTTVTPSDGSQSFTYTIQNDFEEPYFEESIQLTIQPQKNLLFYMTEACNIAPNNFTKFSATYYPSVPGFFIDGINGVFGNWASNQSYWKIFNQMVPLDVGVSVYIPSGGDVILFNLTTDAGH